MLPVNRRYETLVDEYGDTGVMAACEVERWAADQEEPVPVEQDAKADCQGNQIDGP